MLLLSEVVHLVNPANHTREVNHTKKILCDGLDRVSVDNNQTRNLLITRVMVYLLNHLFWDKYNYFLFG